MSLSTRIALFCVPVALAGVGLFAAVSSGLDHDPDRARTVLEEGPVAVGGAAAVRKAGLTPGTARAFAAARAAAAAQGRPLELTSGYRTPEEQRAEFLDGIRKYGSPEAARHYVLPPERSAHVKGTALDIRPEATARWLETEGARFGLCRIYANEWWHFEYAARYAKGGCPGLKRDALG
ncbi:D-alanyl-D-alanine carboxypeptidase family protein [Actinocorallia longicatena]|uniref:D-alanyl-D-alanine carboxypeptidase-like core domain-containing protein n=1 Tax=Actinocorallia longicatena TaxID=111803 RepID=A0ABP6Q3T4_9ACTN